MDGTLAMLSTHSFAPGPPFPPPSLAARDSVTASHSTVTSSGAFRAEAPAAPLVIRPLVSAADQRACIAFQREIWGTTFDPVPASLLQVALHLGGVALGAFDTQGNLGGFVFGLTGIDEHGKVIHWSHMLAVRAHLREAGLGRRLKECQRQELAARHISEMYWTYDPSIAKNAHFNLDILGARVVRYVPDMYGDTGSPLHHGLATDRLVVVCDTARAHEPVSSVLDADDARIPVLTIRPHAGDVLVVVGGASLPRLRLEIPSDFGQLLAARPTEARAWHAATRDHFQWALGSGYSVIGLRRDLATGRSFYLLDKATP